MKNDINLKQFVLLLFELMFFLMLISNGGMSLYSPEKEGVLIEEIDREFVERLAKEKLERARNKEYLEKPYWLSSILISKNTVTRNLNQTKGGELAVLYAKIGILFIALTWLLFLLIRYTTIKNNNFEVKVFAVFKIFLFVFFLSLGFLKVIGNIDPLTFWEYGYLTLLPSLSTYFSLRNIPMLLTIVLGILNLVTIKFAAPPAAPPPPKPPEHKLHH